MGKANRFWVSGFAMCLNERGAIETRAVIWKSRSGESGSVNALLGIGVCARYCRSLAAWYSLLSGHERLPGTKVWLIVAETGNLLIL